MDRIGDGQGLHDLFYAASSIKAYLCEQGVACSNNEDKVDKGLKIAFLDMKKQEPVWDREKCVALSNEEVYLIFISRALTHPPPLLRLCLIPIRQRAGSHSAYSE